MPDNPIAGLYPQPPPPPQQSSNVLNNLPAFAGLISAANQNALFQKEFAAKQAIGRAAQNALNPDGSVDFQRYSSGLKDPAAAYGAQDAVGSLLDQRGRQIANSKAQFELNAGQDVATRDFIANLPTNASNEDILHATTTFARNNPTIPSSVINDWRASIPPPGPARVQYFGTLKNTVIGSAGTSARVQGPVAASGAPTTIPLGQANLPDAGVGAAPAQTPPAAAPSAAAPSAPNPYGTPTGQPIATELPPGEGEARRQVGEASGHQYAADLADSNSFRRSVYPLEQAIPALEKLGTTGTGPGTETLNQVKSYIQSLGVPGVDADKIKNYDEANKYLTDFVNQNGNSGTNDKLAAAFAGNPSVHISNAAAVDVAKSALALRRMKQAQVLEAQSQGVPESQYSKWSSKWVNDQDPRAYGFDVMSGEAQKKLIGSLGPKTGATYQKFIASLRVAHDGGLLTPQAPGGQ